jgi:hypothetical protein
MQRELFFQKLSAEGVNIEPVRLLSWERQKLIPPCHVCNGSMHWPDEAWWQAVAAAYLLDSRGLTASEVRTGRFYMEEPLVAGAGVSAKLDWMASAGGSAQQTDNYEAAFAWAVACIKAQKGWPLLAPAEIKVLHQGAALEYKLEQSLEDSLGDDGHPRRHPYDLFLAASKEDKD